MSMLENHAIKMTWNNLPWNNGLRSLKRYAPTTKRLLSIASQKGYTIDY